MGLPLVAGLYSAMQRTPTVPIPTGITRAGGWSCENTGTTRPSACTRQGGGPCGGINMNSRLPRTFLLITMVAIGSTHAQAAENPTMQELVARELPAVVNIS